MMNYVERNVPVKERTLLKGSLDKKKSAKNNRGLQWGVNFVGLLQVWAQPPPPSLPHLNPTELSSEPVYRDFSGWKLS